MRNVHSITVVALIAAYGCAGAADNEAKSVAGALHASCEGVVDQLPMYAQEAALTANEAGSAYDEDPDNDTAAKYFGMNYDHDLLRQRLTRLVQLGRSSRLTFQCLDESVAECQGKNKTTALWTLSSDWQKSEWTIRVCGDRFWSYGEFSADLGGDATSLGTASRQGVMVHELAHLTGATMGDSVLLREQLIIAGAMDPSGSRAMPENAEAFRYYIMNVN
jgi:hypothetical protein